MTAQSDDQLSVPVGARDHSQGPATARITLVQYGDYECPYSRQARPFVQELQQRFGDHLRYVYRNFPLAHAHPHARHAAEAAEAAGAQGAFWEMYDYLFAHQRELDDDGLMAAAQTLGLDLERFDGDMRQHTYAERVREDHESGVRSGVIGTPTFFVNGVRQGGPGDFDVALAAIEGASTE